MSRRFGRNQRRRAREEIARLAQESALLAEQSQASAKLVANLAKSDNMHRELASYLRRKNDDLREQIATVEQVLGKNFVALEAETMEVGLSEFESNCECMRFHVEQGVSFRVDAALDLARRAMHVRLRCGDKGEFAYVLNQHAIASLSRENLIHVLQENVARDLVPAVVEKLKGVRG